MNAPKSVTVSCRCGAYHIVETVTFGRLKKCQKCGSGYSVLWKRDPKTGKAAPLVVASATPRKKAEPAPESLIDLACNCGYTRKGTRGEVAKMPPCPGCGKPMYLDRKRAPAKPPSSPSNPIPRPPSSGAYPAAGRPPSSSSLPRAEGETKVTKSGKILVICTYCGDRLLVNAERQGGEVKCMRCETVLNVPAAAAPPPPPPPPAPPPPELDEAVFEATPASASATQSIPVVSDGSTLPCPCGTILDIRGASPGSRFTCENCGRRVKFEKARDPQTLRTIMKPIFKEPDVVVDHTTTDVFCACGEALLISSRDLGHPLQCPSCSILMEIQQDGTGLKVKPLGRVDEQNWSLQDFA